MPMKKKEVKFSEDARCLVTGIWLTMGASVCLTFQTPSRINPRAKAALNELIGAGVVELEVEKLRSSETWHYRIADVALLATVPKASKKLMGLNSFSITRE